MTTHTAGKLRTTEGGVNNLMADDGIEVACVRIISGRTDNEDKANAERLALCWNAHDGLVEAIKAILDTEPALRISGDKNLPPFTKALAQARATLAAAEGEDAPR